MHYYWPPPPANLEYQNKYREQMTITGVARAKRKSSHSGISIRHMGSFNFRIAKKLFLLTTGAELRASYEGDDINDNRVQNGGFGFQCIARKTHFSTPGAGSGSLVGDSPSS